MQRVERQEPAGGADCVAVPAAVEPEGHQRRPGLGRQAAQPLPLDLQPVLEARVVDRKARQQVAGVERGRPLDRVRASILEQGLEQPGVDPDEVGVEADRLAVGDQRIDGRGGERAPQAQEGLLQAVAGLAVAAVRPQQRRQRLARVGDAGRQREETQEGPVLLARHLNRLTTLRRDL